MLPTVAAQGSSGSAMATPPSVHRAGAAQNHIVPLHKAATAPLVAAAVTATAVPQGIEPVVLEAAPGAKLCAQSRRKQVHHLLQNWDSFY